MNLEKSIEILNNKKAADGPFSILQVTFFILA